MCWWWKTFRKFREPFLLKNVFASFWNIFGSVHARFLFVFWASQTVSASSVAADAATDEASSYVAGGLGFVHGRWRGHGRSLALGIGHKGSTTTKFKTYHFWSRKVVIIGLYGVVFHGEDACDVQRCVTLQNNMKNLKKLQEILKKSGRCFFRPSKN